MPRTRRRRPKRRSSRTVTEWDVYQLMTGHPLHVGETPLSADELRDVWFDERDQLLAYWLGDQPWPDVWLERWPRLAEDGGPGTRPPAWWRYEAPGPRLVGGRIPETVTVLRGGWKEIQTPRSAADPAWREAITGGFPRYWPLPNGWYSADEFDYETEEAYLDRHGLLTDAERKALEDLDEDTNDDGEAWR